MATETVTTTTTGNMSPVRILIINPNTSTHMTDALRPVVEELGFPDVHYTFFTSPNPDNKGIPSINSPTDAAESAKICFPALQPLVSHHDAFLVACYSAHPLVQMLKNECEKHITSATGRGSRKKYVTGIFEASCLVSLGLVGNASSSSSSSKTLDTDSSDTNNHGLGFGIVSTGKIWEEALGRAVNEFLGLGLESDSTSLSKRSGGRGRFYGCETTGLNASELHDLPAEEVRRKMMDATRRLLRRGRITASSSALRQASGGDGRSSAVKAICLGCAGMVGLESAVREACLEELGSEEAGNNVAIVDGVKAGVGVLYGLVKCGF
ncbi:dal80p-controlled protein [Exophiala dermatitidis]|uniref:Dal80p-controlled protein n=1 Tax=Exophiala dermatitidis TaxID=5970 RepID=A0AAN6EWC6_EXODE|nr:dal80p-controlled protein [Exophiala dermatitidis]KAJ4520937.1 dal80p-controlled protein [Exophiala dermatitidis]KAJ4547513.1 dal80p-controlled protein [Exophiala dermatitidis]KAJ4553453.1 dal80p-controlled protein [Exophiala dermatitidis]KAJ4563322.1 dal80p-controlled protein [Exophiala dermatitidis]